MFHAAPLTLGDVSRTVSRNAPSVISDRMLHVSRASREPARGTRNNGPAGNDSARRGEAVRAQVFTVGIVPYASGPVKKETHFNYWILRSSRALCGERTAPYPVTRSSWRGAGALQQGKCRKGRVTPPGEGNYVAGAQQPSYALTYSSSEKKSSSIRLNSTVRLVLTPTLCSIIRLASRSPFIRITR